MKRIYFAALSYMIAGLTAGFAVRIYVDQIKHFEGDTMLGLLHVHLLALGMLFMLIVLLLEKSFSLSKTRWFNLFFWHYNGGLVLTVLMMIIHGVMQVNGQADSAMIAGIAGLGHIIIAVGLGFFFAALYRRINEK